MRTTVSIDVRNKIYELCKTYLGDKWTDVKEGDLIIQPIIDGNVNKLFICCLPNNIVGRYSKVIVRYSGQEVKEYKSETNVITFNVILSLKKISPKLLTVFNDGFITEYIECRHFNRFDDKNHRTVDLLARKLALLHSMNMPTPKACSNMFSKLMNFPVFKGLQSSYTDGKIRQAIIEKNYQTLLSLDFINELKWVINIVENINSPVVFSHNDFNRKNILVKESKDSSDLLEIFLIDFDWSSYNKRGVDFGQYFSSWNQIEPDFGSGEFPTDEEMTPFIDSYLNEMYKISGEHYSEQQINSRKQLIRESKFFALMAFLKDVVYTFWGLNMNRDILEIGERRYQLYGKLKEKVLKEYIYD